MKIKYKGCDYDLHFNENGAMFSIVDKYNEVVEWLCGRRHEAGSNQCWLDKRFLNQLVEQGIVKTVEPARVELEPGMPQGVILCDIIHPQFNDGGYSLFGDFCRSRLGQQCQYGSRYITGQMDGYPALGEGLRFKNTDSGNYHSIRIHRDDMDEFERRYKAYQDGRLG